MRLNITLYEHEKATTQNSYDDPIVISIVGAYKDGVQNQNVRWS